MRSHDNLTSHPSAPETRSEGRSPGRRTLTERLPMRKAIIASSADSHEREADAAADAALSGRPVGALTAVDAGAVQADGVEADGVAATPELDDALASSGGAGLDAATRTRMEGAFGRDFSAVRVHTGGAAAAAASSIQAHAFTTGNDIYFAAGKYAPNTADGAHLLAHELTHTVQQSGRSAVQAKLIQREAGSAPAKGAATSAVKDPTTHIEKAKNAYQSCFEKQLLGLDNLKTDFGTKDQPSIGEEALKLAVSVALSAAAGHLAAGIANAVVQRSARYAAERGAAQAEKSAMEHFIDQNSKPDDPAESPLAKAVAAKMGEHIKTGLEFSAPKAVGALSGGTPSFQKFYEAQRKSLIEVKKSAIDFLIDSTEEFKTKSNGYDEARALCDGVTEAYEVAESTQYLKSLTEWWKLAGDGGVLNRPGKLVVVLDAPTPDAPLNPVGARAKGLNDAMRARLKSDAAIGSTVLWECGLPVVFTIKIKAFGNWITDYTFDIAGKAGGPPLEFPTSGTPAWWMYYRNHGHDPKPGERTDETALAVAWAIWADRMNKLTLGSIGNIED